MGNVAFDTLTASKDLQKAGFEPSQADAIALVVKDVQGDLATKSDLEHLATKEDLAQVKSSMNHLATKEDLARVKSDIIWLKWVVGLSLPVIVGAMIGGFSIIASMLP